MIKTEVIHVIKIRENKNYIYPTSFSIDGPAVLSIPEKDFVMDENDDENKIVDDPFKLHIYENFFKTLPELSEVMFDTNEKLKTSYVTINDSSIEFRIISEKASFVILKFKTDNKKIPRVFGNTGRTLFNKTATNILNKDSEYQLNLFMDDFVYENNFKTEYEYFYSTVDQIRRDTGEFLKDVSDQTIIQYIHENSIIAENAATALLENEQEESTISKINQSKNLYVRYKTDLDLLVAGYYTIAGSIGTIRKKVYTVEVEKQIKLPYLDELLKDLKGKLYEPEKVLFGSKIITTDTLKAGDTDFPLTTPRRWRNSRERTMD